MTESPLAVALLVDADNAALDSLDQVLAALATQGQVQIRRAYGNWFKTALRSWDAELNRRGFRALQQSDPVKGKNATDLALVIDAVDLHHTVAPDVFALVSSDSDYTPLAHYLRERGVKVLGFGRPSTAPSFQVACTTFTPIQGNDAPAPNGTRSRNRNESATDSPRATGRRDRQERRQTGLGPSQRSRELHAPAPRSVRRRTTARPPGPRCSRPCPGYEFRNEGTTSVAVRVK